jgi:RHS repeat-associated protein
VTISSALAARCRDGVIVIGVVDDDARHAAHCLDSRASFRLLVQPRTLSIEQGRNRLLALDNPPRSLRYDAAGNVMGDAEPGRQWSARYDLRGRLARLASSGAQGVQQAEYRYDTQGRRVLKKVGSSAPCRIGERCAVPPGLPTGIAYVPDLDGRLLGEYRLPHGNVIREYVWLHDVPVAVVADEYAGTSRAEGVPVFFVHADHLNTPRVVVDRAGALRWSWLAESFGHSRPTESFAGSRAFVLNLRMPGQCFDAESGLRHNWHRQYYASVGRYTQSDPIGLAGGINTYAYVENNPLSFTDPEGLVKLHGNWCGPNWTGGFTKSYDKLSDAERKAALPPVTKLDSCCQTHDIVYAVCRKANPCDAVARQKCFEQADRDLSSCGSRSGSGYGANLLLFGNPQKRIQDYMRDSSPAAGDNAKECSCSK